MNILIVKMSAVGDVIHTLPALHALRVHYPKSHISWLVEEDAQGIVLDHPDLDRVLVSRRKTWLKRIGRPGGTATLQEVYRFVRDLRATRYDMIFDFQGLLKSGILVALARGSRKVGFDRGMQHAEESHLFLNERVPPVDMDVHALTRGLILLERSLGIRSPEVVYNLSIPSADAAYIENLLEQARIDSARPLVVLHPAAKWDTKLWENWKFSNLADRLIDECDAQVVFTGGKGDIDLVREICSGMTHRGHDFSGRTTLKQLAALCKRADCVISTDTGPMHLAAAVETPVVALFGPTAPWRTGPFGPNHAAIRVGLDCSPCFKRACKTRTCMKKITVTRVMAKVKSISTFMA